MSVTIKVTVDDKAAAARITKFAKKAGADVKKLEKQTVKSGARMKKAFQGVSSALGPLGIAGGLTGVVFGLKAFFSATAGFETTMAEVSTIVDTSTVSMKSLTDQILEMTKTIPQTADELGAGLYETISAGVTDTAEAMIFLKTASKLAVAGLSDTATTVDALTTVINAYGLDVKEATRVSDLLFKTVEAGKTKIPVLAGSIGNVASSAALAGVEIEELTAAIAIMTKATGQTDETMTSLNRLFLSITNSTPVVQKAAKKLGIEWSASALRAKGFAKFMEELTVALSKDKDAIFDLGLDMRAFKALAILGGNSAEAFAKQITAMGDAAGATEIAFQKMNSTASNQFQLFKNQLSGVMQKIGQAILPGITAALKDVNTVAGKRGFLGVLELMRDPLQFFLQKTVIQTNATIAAFEAQKKLNEAIKSTPLKPPGGATPVAAAKTELDIIKETGNVRKKNFATIEVGQQMQILGLKKLNIGSQTQILLSDRLVSSVFEIANGLGQALLNTESLGEALKGVLRQLASKTLSALILGGVSSIFGGSFLAPLREVFGFAGGGRPPVGSDVIVGENGPEIFRADRPGTIIPNNQITNNAPVFNISITTQTIDEFFVNTKLIPILQRTADRGGFTFAAS